jgi:hypothetical protein
VDPADDDRLRGAPGGDRRDGLVSAHAPIGSLHGEPGSVAVLTPLMSADGMIVAASTTLLAKSRSAAGAASCPGALLVVGSVASLAANVAVAEPTATGRLITGWPSLELIAWYELLMRQDAGPPTPGHPGSGRAAPVRMSRCGSLPLMFAMRIIRCHRQLDPPAFSATRDPPRHQVLARPRSGTRRT